MGLSDRSVVYAEPNSPCGFLVPPTGHVRVSVRHLPLTSIGSSRLFLIKTMTGPLAELVMEPWDLLLESQGPSAGVRSFMHNLLTPPRVSIENLLLIYRSVFSLASSDSKSDWKSMLSDTDH